MPDPAIIGTGRRNGEFAVMGRGELNSVYFNRKIINWVNHENRLRNGVRYRQTVGKEDEDRVKFIEPKKVLKISFISLVKLTF